MMTPWIAILALAALGGIFLINWLRVEKGVSLGKIFFRKKNIIHMEKEPGVTEVTVEEIMSATDKTDPKDAAKADSLVKRAEAHLKKGDAEEAKRMLIQALSLDPAATAAYSRLGLIYLHEGQFGKAENIYRKLIVAVIDEPSFFGNLGMALYSQGKFDEAKSHYRKAIELDPGRAGRFFSLAQIMRELGEFDEAVNHLRKAVDMEPRNLDFMLSLAELYIESKMPSEARQMLAAVLLLSPDNPDALAMLKSVEGEG